MLKNTNEIINTNDIDRISSIFSFIKHDIKLLNKIYINIPNKIIKIEYPNNSIFSNSFLFVSYLFDNSVYTKVLKGDNGKVIIIPILFAIKYIPRAFKPKKYVIKTLSDKFKIQ